MLSGWGRPWASLSAFCSPNLVALSAYSAPPRCTSPASSATSPESVRTTSRPELSMPAPVPVWPLQRTSRPSSASRARTASSTVVDAGAEPALERAEQGRQRRLDRTRLEPERAGAVAEVGREVLRAQRHVQADPDDRPPFLHARLDEDARDLAPVHEHIVGPFDRHPRSVSGHPRPVSGLPRPVSGHPRPDPATATPPPTTPRPPPPPPPPPAAATAAAPGPRSSTAAPALPARSRSAPGAPGPPTARPRSRACRAARHDPRTRGRGRSWSRSAGNAPGDCRAARQPGP